MDTSSEQPLGLRPDAVTINQEIEVKLLAPAGGTHRILTLPALTRVSFQPRARSLGTIYYDSADGALQKAGVALRVRRVLGRHIMTVKFPANLAKGAFGREEIEARLPSHVPDIDKFGIDVAARIRQVIGEATVSPVFATQFKRRTGVIESGRSQIEIALDSGMVEAAGKQQALDEIELELKDGEEADLYEFAASMAREGGLRLSPVTKAQRGSQLASGAAPDFCKASVPAMAPGLLVLDDYIATVINLCLGQFVANWPAIEAAAGPEGVHQARVSLRRLRAMLGLFARIVPAPEFQSFRAEAKQIASALGPARDWDVFIDMVYQGPLAIYPADRSFDTLLSGARARRGDSYEQARQIVADPKTTCFVLDLRAFAARRGWRNVLTGAQLPVLGETARAFCARAMSRLDKRCVRRGRQLAKLGAEERHNLRIELKKLRYAAEFCGPFFGASGVQKRYTRAAGRLQDVLGAFNDEAVAHGLVDTLEAEGKAEMARAAGVVLGWCARGRTDADLGLKIAWRRFENSRRFWE